MDETMVTKGYYPKKTVTSNKEGEKCFVKKKKG